MPPIPGIKGGFWGGAGRFAEDVQTALGHMWGSARAFGGGMLRGDPFGAVGRYTDAGTAAARTAYQRGVPRATAAWVGGAGSGQGLGEYLRGGSASMQRLRGTWHTARAGRGMRKVGAGLMYGVGGYAALRTFGGDTMGETAGRFGGFAMGYGRKRGGMLKGPRGLARGGVYGAIGGAIGGWL